MSLVSKWWSSVSYMPRWGEDLRRFMSGTIGITTGILFGRERPSVVWENIETAYADQDKNRIAISAMMLSEKEDERPNKKASKTDAMAAVLGFLVHELAHFVYSPKTIPGLLNPGIPLNELTATVANVIEDLFIEDAIVKRESSFGWMIKAGWEYIFPVKEIEKRLSKWDGTSLVNLGEALNVMICWKNHNYFFEFRSEFEEKLFNLVMSVKGMYALDDRKNLIEEVVRLLLDTRKEETGEDLEQIMKEQGEALEKLEEELRKLLEKMMEGEITFDAGGELIKIDAKSRPFYGESDALPYECFAKFESFSVEGNVIVSWVSPIAEGAGKLAYDKKWREFKSFAADQGTVRRIRGASGMHGKLTHPANLHVNGQIFSNAKIMAPNGSTGLEGAPQDIILVDVSGSMGGTMQNGETKFIEALKAAQGAIDGLVEAKHRTAVYAHTTGMATATTEGCTMYVLKNFADGPAAAAKAISDMYALGSQNSNADSFAIEAAAGKFVRDGSPMRLWVISDGQPACSLYAGDEGIDKTKKSVDKLRKQGIEVYSFSIDSSAINPNNRIYGLKNNFNAQDPDVIRKVMRRFV